MALTFDDGPNAPWTQRILDVLRAHGADATFFDEGLQVQANPGMPREELDAGMAVGSHSFAHSEKLPTMSPADFSRDLSIADDALASALGHHPALYRSPFGHTSATMLTELRRNGYVSIGWDTDSRDWADDSTVDDVVSNVVDHAHPGAIVLMHDGGLSGGNPDRSKTVAALPRIIDALHARGYDLVTIPELTGAPDQQGVPRRPLCSAS